MIEDMMKVSIVLLNKEKEDALKALRKVGVVHLEKIEGASEKLSAFKEYTNNTNVSEAILGEFNKSEKSKDKRAQKLSLSDEKVISLCSEIVAKADRKKQLLDEISANTTELDRFSKWGTVNLEDIKYLKEKGIQLKQDAVAFMESVKEDAQDIAAEAAYNQSQTQNA